MVTSIVLVEYGPELTRLPDGSYEESKLIRVLGNGEPHEQKGLIEFKWMRSLWRKSWFHAVYAIAWTVILVVSVVLNQPQSIWAGVLMSLAAAFLIALMLHRFDRILLKFMLTTSIDYLYLMVCHAYAKGVDPRVASAFDTFCAHLQPFFLSICLSLVFVRVQQLSTAVQLAGVFCLHLLAKFK
jgi:hypothetical protein